MNRTEAKAKNIVHFDGRPCKRCKETLRYTCSNLCVTCSKARAKKYRDSIPRKGRKKTARQIAAENGQKFYTLKPCKRCGDPERYTSTGACKSCATGYKPKPEEERLIRTRKDACFFGEPCGTCGSTEKYKQSGQCAPCQRRRLRGERVHKEPKKIEYLYGPKCNRCGTSKRYKNKQCVKCHSDWNKKHRHKYRPKPVRKPPEFVEGKRCPAGHTLRYKSTGACVECQRAAVKNYKERQRERFDKD